jgi:hypothetical protein
MEGKNIMRASSSSNLSNVVNTLTSQEINGVKIFNNNIVGNSNLEISGNVVLGSGGNNPTIIIQNHLIIPTTPPVTPVNGSIWIE